MLDGILAVWFGARGNLFGGAFGGLVTAAEAQEDAGCDGHFLVWVWVANWYFVRG